MVGCALERAAHPRVQRMVGRFEREQQDGLNARARAGVLGLAGIEEAAVGGVEPCLSDCPYGPRAGKKVAELDRGGGPELRSILKPHPRRGDYTENAFRADERPVGARAGTGTRKP